MSDSLIDALPSELATELRKSLTQEKMGIRFLDEKHFRSESLEVLERAFATLAPEAKFAALRLMRECARSACCLAVELGVENFPVPLFEVTASTRPLLKDLVASCAKQGLALPLFILDDSWDLCLWIYRAVLEDGYRGPLYLCPKNPTGGNTAFAQVGIVNTRPEKVVDLDASSLHGSIGELKRLNWFRTRILPLSEPWMHTGVLNPPST